LDSSQERVEVEAEAGDQEGGLNQDPECKGLQDNNPQEEDVDQFPSKNVPHKCNKSVP